MAKLTLSVDDDLLHRARKRALAQHTTVNTVVREFLEAFAEESPAREAIARFLDLAESAAASSGPQGRSGIREVRVPQK